MRAFVAIDVGDAPPPSAAPPPGRTAEHLTLRFLGEVEAARVASIAAALRAVAPKFRPFALTLEGVGAFPSRTNPRVVWVGATEGRAEVVALAAAIEDALAPLGIPRAPAPFVPHLTLFRVRSPADRRRARRLLAGDAPPPDPRRVRVAEFRLKESVLGPAGAVHRTFERFAFPGGPGGLA